MTKGLLKSIDSPDHLKINKDQGKIFQFLSSNRIVGTAQLLNKEKQMSGTFKNSSPIRVNQLDDLKKESNSPLKISNHDSKNILKISSGLHHEKDRLLALRNAKQVNEQKRKDRTER